MKIFNAVLSTVCAILVCATIPILNVNAQNLVPNPSFEDTVFCPVALTQLYATKHWLNFGISPDYYNACSTTGVNVPNSLAGYQYAHSGDGMAGILLKRKQLGTTGPNTREYIASQLASNLNIGLRYYFSCYINFSNNPQGAIACNKIGMKLSTNSYDSTQYISLVNNFAHLYSDSIISDSIQWFKLSGSFIADSNYQYLILGNFFQDQFTDTISFGQFPDVSYYYIDDVCLSLDSNFCENWTIQPNEIKEYSSNIVIFPVPVIDKLNIESDDPVNYIEISNSIGKICYVHKISKGMKSPIDISNLSMGLYFIKIETTNSIFYKRILKF